jgi:SRSO17 transposase
MQRLLTGARWDCDAVRDEVQDYVRERTGDAAAVLCLAETTFEKRGRTPAGVGRHYDPVAGRYVNSQLGLFLAYLCPGRAPAFVDRKLYIPPAGSADPHTGGPTASETRAATRAELARDMIARARRRQLPCRWISGSVAYGADKALRAWLDQESLPYVLEVPATLRSLRRDDRNTAAAYLDQLTTEVRAARWYQPASPSGTVDLFPHEWLRIPLRKANGAQNERWLLLRRATRSHTVAGYLCLAPPHTLLPALVSVAKTGASVEAAFQLARAYAGLDQYQVRGEDPWYRHITLAMAAYAFLATALLNDQSLPPPSWLPHPATAPHLHPPTARKKRNRDKANSHDDHRDRSGDHEERTGNH